MTLAPGERLGAYEILGPLGAGGMGQVYRARDRRLERDVALKVLPPHLADHPDALARFEREAKAVAALSHPNILAIFDIGAEAGRAFAVMELLEGETLRTRLQGGALPTRKAIEIAVQIANGLAAAHERGIVHRDLKPDNVFVLGDGRVKILDFGLAKQGASPGSQSQLLAAPTIGPSSPGTEPGAVLGTVGYMSPEQVKGLPADARSDLFALGVILYELLTGRRAFAGDSSVETMSAILKEEPPELHLLAAKIPPALDHVLRRCLEKAPGERFQSARDLAFALRDSTASSTGSDVAAAAMAARGAGRSRAVRLFAAFVVTALAAAAAGWFAARLAGGPDTASPPLRPEFRQITKQPGAEFRPALSPDGESLVFERNVDGQLDLFLQRVDGQTSIPLTGACESDDSEAAFSPDGRLLAYRSECQGGGLFVMGATGENVRKVADFGHNPTWSPDGREIAVSTASAPLPWNRPNQGELWAVSVDTGAKRLVTRGDALNPAWSPHGRRIAYWGLEPDSFVRNLWTAAADGSEPDFAQTVRLTEDPHLDCNPVWSADGRFLYFASYRGGTLNLWRLPVDEESGRARGEPEPVTVPSGNAGWLSAARDGDRIAFVDRNARTAVFRAPIDARRGSLTGPPELLYQGSIEAFDAELSPTGDELVLSSTDQPQHLYLLGPGGTFRQLTDGPFRDRQVAWSPDGRWIAFQTSRFPGGLAMIRPDGGGLREVARGANSLGEPLYSPDGRFLATFGQPGLLFDLTGDFAVESSVSLSPPGENAVFNPTSFSPDGRRILGMIISAGTLDAVGSYSVADGSWQTIEEAGVSFPLLLDDRGTMLWLRKGRVELRDRAGGLLGVVLTPPAGHEIYYIGLSGDRRWLSWIDATDESDIWLMTLAAPGERPD